MQAAGDAGWWRPREAALLAVGTCAEVLLAARGAAAAGFAQPGSAAHFDLDGLLASVAAEDLGQPGSPPFLVGRALWLAARCASVRSSRVSKAIVHGIVPGEGGKVLVCLVESRLSGTGLWSEDRPG